jgi:hypothetical protein
MFIRTIVYVVLLATLAGCASSHVLVGTPRAAIPPDQVKVYLHPPANYEEIALVDATSRHGMAFTDQQKMNKVIDRMKEEAASVGANGLLLAGLGDVATGSVGGGSSTATAYGNTAHATGLGFSSEVFQKAGKALAIYVPPQ